MSVQTASVVAGSSATVLFHNRWGANIPVTFTTHGNSADVFIGGNTVTASSNGIAAPKSQNLQIVVPAGETVYCAGNGTDTVKYLAFVDG